MIKLKDILNEGLYHVGYNKGRGQGKGVFKDSYSSYKDAKKAVEKLEKERGGSYNTIAYYVSDKDGNFVRESVNELKLKDLVGNQYKYVIGSGEEKYLGNNDKKYVLEMIAKSLKTYLYDEDFALNYLDNSQRKEYNSFFENEVLLPMLKKIDFTLNTFFTLDKDKVKWKLSSNDTRKMVDEIFRKNSKVPSDIKKEYYEYRLEYAGVKLKESVNEATMPPVRKVVNVILKKHGVVPMKTTSTSVRGFHNIQRGGYRYEGNYFLGFYGVPQDIIDKVGAEMEKAGVKGVDVRKGIISADFTKTGLKESVNEGNWSKIMAGVRKGSQSGSWTIVVIKNNKVIHQKDVKFRDAIPAHYEDIKKKFKGATLGIEDGSGQMVYTEKI